MKLSLALLGICLLGLSHAGIIVSPNTDKPKLSKAYDQVSAHLSNRDSGFDCHHDITVCAGETVELTSPGYPGYDANTNCTATVSVPADTAVMVYCSAFDLGQGDYLYVVLDGDIYNATVLGGNDLLDAMLIVEPSEAELELWVDFESDDQDEGDGFMCEITGAAEGSGGPEGPPPGPPPPPPPPPTTVPSGECPCGQANEGNRIVNGVETSSNKYPWQVALVSPGSRTPFCGGTIINSKYIMTAAHCTADGRTFEIVVGEHDHTDTSTGKVVAVKEVKQHPTYNGETIDNDFSLVELAEELTFTDAVRPACLPKDENNAYVGAEAVVSGWGTLSSGGSQPNKLNEVTVNVVANDPCGNYGSGQITGNMLCATADSKDSCQGDSGGPLVTKESSGRYSLIGVVSWGRGCAEDGYPGVYARITRVLPWIQSTTAGTETCNV